MKRVLVTQILQLRYIYENFLKDLSSSYPDFRDWFWNKLIPKVQHNKCHVFMYFKNNDIVGVGIVDTFQNKLSTVRVSKKYEYQGIGIRIIKDCLSFLGSDKPMCSVSEDLFHDYSRIFVNYFGFDLTYVYKGLYKKDKLEYEFNGSGNLAIKTDY